MCGKFSGSIHFNEHDSINMLYDVNSLQQDKLSIV